MNTVLLATLDGVSTAECVVGVLLGRQLMDLGHTTHSIDVSQLEGDPQRTNVDVCIVLAGLPSNPDTKQIMDFVNYVHQVCGKPIPTVVLCIEAPAGEGLTERVVSVSVMQHGAEVITEVIRVVQGMLTESTS